MISFSNFKSEIVKNCFIFMLKHFTIAKMCAFRYTHSIFSDPIEVQLRVWFDNNILLKKKDE